MTQAIKDPLTFIDEFSEPHMVLGHEVKFRAVSLETLFKLRIIAGPMAKAIAVLFAPTSGDIGTVHRELAASPEALEIVRDQLKGMDADDRRAAMFMQMVSTIKDKETVVEPVSLALAQKRGDDQANAIQELVGVLTNPEAIGVLGSIVYDSIKRDMWTEGMTAPSVEEFTARLNGPSLYDFMKAVAIVNKGTLGPLASALGGTQMKAVVEAIQSRVAQVGQGASESDSPEKTPANEPIPSSEPTTPAVPVAG